MKNIVKNIILIVALSAVILMVIGILIYDYIPSANTVAEPNTYETDSTTTKIIAEINDNSSSLTSTTDSSSSTSGTSSVVLKSYSITETDLAIYSASSSYVKGKSDPFAEYTEETTDDGTSGETGDTSSGEGASSASSASSSSSSTSGNTTSSNSSTSSDGTLFNSTSSK